MGLLREKLVKEDLDLGYGSTTITADDGSRLVANKIGLHTFNEEINVRTAFGAVGDGSTDDTTAIANALTQIRTNGGGVLYFPPGTYITEEMRVPDEIIIKGAGRDVTTIKLKGSVSGQSVIINRAWSTGVRNSFGVIRDLTVDGNKSNQTPADNHMGIRAYGWDYLVIENVKIVNCAKDGFYIDASDVISSNYIWVRNLIVDGCRRNGMSVIAAHRLWVEDSAFLNTSGEAPQAGLDIEPDNSTEVTRDIWFKNCVFAGNTGEGVAQSASPFTSASPISIHFVGCKAIGNRRGFDFDQTPSTAGPGIIEVKDCIALQNSDIGFLVRGKDVSGPRVILRDCFAQDNATGTINDTEGSRAQFKVMGQVGGITPGGVDIINCSAAITTGVDKYGLVIGKSAGNDIDDVYIHNFRYRNDVGTQFWSLADFDRVFITGDQSHFSQGLNFKRRAITTNTSLAAADHESIITNSGASADVTATLPVCPDPASQTLRYRFIREDSADTLIIAPQSGETILGAGGVSTSVRLPAWGSSVIIHNNSTTGTWVMEECDPSTQQNLPMIGRAVTSASTVGNSQFSFYFSGNDLMVQMRDSGGTLRTHNIGTLT